MISKTSHVLLAVCGVRRHYLLKFTQRATSENGHDRASRTELARQSLGDRWRHPSPSAHAINGNYTQGEWSRVDLHVSCTRYNTLMTIGLCRGTNYWLDSALLELFLFVHREMISSEYKTFHLMKNRILSTGVAKCQSDKRAPSS